jgi:outer membrane immunogenic protein
MRIIKSANFGVVAATAALLGTHVAWGADMALKAPPAPTAFSWAGFYVGANAGGTWDGGRFSSSTGAGYTLPPFAFSDPNGVFVPGGSFLVFVPGTIPLPGTAGLGGGRSFLGGLQAGYNWQVGALVYGLEGQIDGLKVSRALGFTGPALTFTGISSFTSESLTGSGTIERDLEGSFRARFGYARDRWLVYGTAGVAVTSISARGNFAYNLTLGPGLTPIAGLSNPSGTSSGSSSRTLVGPTIGGGAEYAVSQHVSVGLEYRHTFYGQQNVSFGTTPTLTSFGAGGITTSGAPVGGSYRLDTDEVMVRVSYLFNR